MSLRNSKLLRRSIAIGDALFVLWTLYNGMDEGWKARPVAFMSYIVLLILLTLSSVLIFTA